MTMTLRNFDCVGKGPPIVLLHGALSDSRIWQPLIGSLCSKFTLLSYNQIFYDADGSPVPLEGHAAHLIKIIDQSGISEVSVFAWSWGASIALLAAIKATKIKKLVFYEPGGPPLTHLLLTTATKSIGKQTTRQIRPLPIQDDGEAAKALIESLHGLGDGHYDYAGFSDEERRIHSANASHLRAIYSIQFGFNASMLASISQPTLIMFGGLTKNMRLRKIARLCHKLIPHSEFSLIENAKHSGPITHFHDVASELDRFIRREPKK